jgi:hypothetical protein
VTVLALPLQNKKITVHFDAANYQETYLEIQRNCST